MTQHEAIPAIDPFPDPMPGARLKAIRKKLRLPVIAFGRALGYGGTENTISTVVRKYELGTRDIPRYIARLAYMLERHGVPPEFLVEAPPTRTRPRPVTDAEADPEERS